MLTQKAIFFDRDNTLIVNSGYLGNPSQVVLAPGAAIAVAKACRLGFKTIVVSNQSGVAKGLFTEADVQAVDARMAELLVQENPEARIDLHFYCPFHPQAQILAYRQESPLRKPNPGMLLMAALQLGLNLKDSFVVGDSPRDVQAGQAAGCRTILVQDPQLSISPAALEPLTASPDFVASSLLEAMAWIESM